MLQSNKYWKTLLGAFAEALVGKQLAYTTQTTYAAFVASAAEGQMAVVNATTLAVLDGAAAAGASVPLFIALKRDGNIEKTGVFTLGTYSVKKLAYAAEVAQASYVTIPAVPVVGKYYSIKVIETTPGYQPFPSWEYGVVAKTGETAASLAGKLIDLINDTANVVNKDTDPIVTAAILSTTSVRMVAKSGGVTFRIGLSADMLDLGSAAVYSGANTASAYVGNGTYPQVAALEEVTNVYKGVTTNAPDQATPEQFGRPTAFATPGVTYTIYYLEGSRSEWSPTPVEKHTHKHQIIIASPSNGATKPDTELSKILGF